MQLENTPNVPGLDLPGIDIVSLGKGYGATAARAATVDAIRAEFTRALTGNGVFVLEIPIDKATGSLLKV